MTTEDGWTIGRLICLYCSHLLEEHDVVGHEGDRELLACTVKTCRCELVEGTC